VTDYLASLPEAQVAGWYRRLADRVAREKIDGKDPLAAIFLRHWLDNRDPKSTFEFHAPDYLQQSKYVTSVLQFHREVLLTQQQARFTGGKRKWAGVLPRIQGLSGFTRWDLSKPLEMQYESLVEIGSGLIEIARIQQAGTNQERDLFGSLRGFQLRSKVKVSGVRLPKPSTMIRITFISWQCQVLDRYDFDYSEHLTFPNPDYGSRDKEAVRPQDKLLTVYHKNAERLEKAGLAAPYDIKSKEWSVTDSRITKPGEVDPNRRL
jgi:hypothetical protein